MEPAEPMCRMPGMTTPTVTELQIVLQPVLPSTFVYPAVREGDPRPGTATLSVARRIVD
jgi:hypothetical protein